MGFIDKLFIEGKLDKLYEEKYRIKNVLAGILEELKRELSKEHKERLSKALELEEENLKKVQKYIYELLTKDTK